MTQEPTQSLTALHVPGAAEACIAGEQQDVVLPLMAAIEIVVLYAGCVAEKLLDPDCDPKDWLGLSDIDEIESLLEGCGQDGNEPLHQSLIAVCANYLAEHWPYVEALAEALLRDGRIVKSKDIRRILGKRTFPPRKVVEKIARAWNAGLDGSRLSADEFYRLLERAEKVRRVAERFDPWSLYRLKPNGERVSAGSVK